MIPFEIGNSYSREELFVSSKKEGTTITWYNDSDMNGKDAVHMDFYYSTYDIWFVFERIEAAVMYYKCVYKN